MKTETINVNVVGRILKVPCALFFAIVATISLLLLVGCTSLDPSSSAASSSSDEAPGSSENPSSLSVDTSSESSSTMSEHDTFGPLQAVEFSDSGNMLGNLYRIETDSGEDGSLILRETDSPQHDQRATIKEYRAPDDLLDQISKIADEAGMKDWGDLPMSEFFPLDASTPTITLVYECTDPNQYFPIRVSFTRYEELPEGGDEAFRAVIDTLENCLTEDNLIREYQEADRD